MQPEKRKIPNKNDLPWRRFGTPRSMSQVALCWGPDPAKGRHQIQPGERRYYDNGVNQKSIKLGPICVPCRQLVDPTYAPDAEPSDLEVICERLHKIDNALVQTDMNIENRLAAMAAREINPNEALLKALDDRIDAQNEQFKRLQVHIKDIDKRVAELAGGLLEEVEQLNDKLDRLLSRGTKSSWEVEREAQRRREGGTR